MSKKQSTKNTSDQIGGNVEVFIRRNAGATADFMSGMSEAVSHAFRSFGEEISSESIDQGGLANGLVKGVVVGNVTFFEGVAKTMRTVFEDLFPEDDEPDDKSTQNKN